MIDKSKAKLNMRVQWTKFIVVLVLYLLFLYWLKSWLGLIVVPFIYDVYITKKIRWQWWKDSEGPIRFIMSWVDALVLDRKSTRLNSSHANISYAVFCLTKKNRSLEASTSELDI